MSNKSFEIGLIIAGCLILATAAMALAAGRYPWTAGALTVAKEVTSKPPVAPEKGQSGCNTQTITKGAIQGKYSSVAGYVSYSADVVTAAGAAEPVKWELDGTQVATGPGFEFVNSRGTEYSRAVQRVYSAVARSLTSCTRRR
jgi:hypothetical protein